MTSIAADITSTTAEPDATSAVSPSSSAAVASNTAADQMTSFVSAVSSTAARDATPAVLASTSAQKQLTLVQIDGRCYNRQPTAIYKKLSHRLHPVNWGWGHHSGHSVGSADRIASGEERLSVAA